MSCSSRSLLLCTIWLIANGAAGCSGWSRSHAASVSVISASHSSSCDAGRAFSAGIEPTTPALHCAMTSFGLLMMNSGAPMIGSGRCGQDGRARAWTGFRRSKGRVRTASTASGRCTPSAPSTMLSRSAGRLAQQVVGIEARGGDLGAHELGVTGPRRVRPRRRAASAPSASRQSRCRPASGTARCRRRPRSGSPWHWPATKSTTSIERRARRPQAAVPSGVRQRCRGAAPVPPRCPRSARRWRAPSRRRRARVLRPTRSLAWIAVVPS